MAVIFTQDIAINTVLPAYNNNVIRFYSDTSSKTALTANIVINSKTIVLYPTQTGEFYFNFREYVTAIVNQNRFIDLVNPDLDPLDNTTFVYAGTGFFSDNVAFETRDHGRGAAARIAPLMATSLQWSGRECARQTAAYEADVTRIFGIDAP